MTVVQQKDTTYTKLFVGGLPYHTTDQSLRDYFRQFGDIEEAVVITDRQTGKSRGYGFVTMAERAAAERICKDPNPIIDGRKANVNLAYLGAKPRIQATELLAALPLGLKAGFGLPTCGFGTQFIGIPQPIYPTAAYFAAAAAGSPLSAAYPFGTPFTQTAGGTLTPAGALQTPGHGAAVTIPAVTAGGFTGPATAITAGSSPTAVSFLDYSTAAAAAAAAAAASHHPQSPVGLHGYTTAGFHESGAPSATYGTAAFQIPAAAAAAAGGYLFAATAGGHDQIAAMTPGTPGGFQTTGGFAATHHGQLTMAGALTAYHPQATALYQQ